MKPAPKKEAAELVDSINEIREMLAQRLEQNQKAKEDQKSTTNRMDSMLYSLHR